MSNNARVAPVRSPDGLIVHTTEISDPGRLADCLPGQLPDRSVPARPASAAAAPGPGYLADQAPLAWIRRGDGLVGWGEAARVCVPAGADRFTAGAKWLREIFDGAEVRDEVGEAGCGPVAFGSFTFDPVSDGSVLIVPEVLIGRRGGRAWRTVITSRTPAGRAAVPGPGTPLPASPARPAEIRWHDGGLTAPQWQRAVAAAVRRIRAGELRKVVLARDLHASASAPIDVRAVLARLADRYPDCYTFSCAGLAGATPDLLVRRMGTEVSSLVLAGTLPRGGTPEQDAALGAALLASAKDTEEHRYAVADVRAALGPLCPGLEVDDQPWLLKLANVQHLATSVRGRLGAGGVTGAPGAGAAVGAAAAAGAGRGPTALALAGAMHPTAAVCGTPADAAMELIRELEGMDRGRYGGPVGWVDTGGNGEWGIALRCAELAGNRARLIAGGGIVAGSDPAAELAEVQAKFRPLQDALEG